MDNILARIINRTDNSNNWLKYNPILESGEIGYDSDVRKIKIGDGVSRWEELPFGVLNITWDNIEDKPEFADVAFNGEYSSLHNRPQIGNGKVTIQHDGNTVGAFTMNQNTNVDINIPNSAPSVSDGLQIADNGDLKVKIDTTLKTNARGELGLAQEYVTADKYMYLIGTTEKGEEIRLIIYGELK